VLLDHRHKPWIVATGIVAVAATALYVWLDSRSLNPLRGGSTVGLWYGIIGSALMIFAGLLSALRKVPAWWWIGSRQAWLRGHIWLGLLSVVFIACHAHARFGGGFVERALWIVLAAVIGSGIFGLVIQQFLPRWLAQRCADEAPYEQIPYLCRILRGKADAAVDEVAPLPADEGTFGSELRVFHERHVRPFLAVPMPRASVLREEQRAASVFDGLRKRLDLSGAGATVLAATDRLEELCRDRRQLAEQERLHHWLHGWLLMHIPLSVALLVLGVAHAVMSLNPNMWTK
jgi:hypothetical protein